MSDQLKQKEVEERAAAVVAINEGIESFARGEGLPAREALARLSLKLGLTSSARSNNAQEFPLHLAVMRCDYEAVKDCLQRSLPINAFDDHNHTPLHWAVMGGHEDIIALLLQHGADPLAEGDYETTPLWYAIDFLGETAITKMLRQAIAENTPPSNASNPRICKPSKPTASGISAHPN